MQCEHEHDLEVAVIEAFVREPGTTADEIAAQLGCSPEDVKQTRFYKRVIIARFARDPKAFENFPQQHFA